MKKLIALALISVFCISLCACVNDEVTFDDTDNGSATNEVTEINGPENGTANTDPGDSNNTSDTNGSTDTDGSTDNTDNTTDTQKPSSDTTNEWTNNY